MPRPIHLLIFNSPIFPAHWALWIPSTVTPKLGKILQASGDAANGFEIVFERNYNILEITGRYQVVLLGHVPDQNVVDTDVDGDPSSDSTARDYVEEVALSVPAPGKSLNSVSAEGSRQRVVIQNCQTWLRQVVDALVQKGVLDQSALQIVDEAPKN